MESLLYIDPNIFFPCFFGFLFVCFENQFKKISALCQIVLIEVNYNLIIGLSIKLLCTSLMLFL